MFVDEARSPLTIGISVDRMRGREQPFAPGMRPSFTAQYRSALLQKDSGVFFGQYEYPSSLRENQRYYPSSSGSFFGRAGYAASRIFITSNDSGEKTLNASHFFRVLSSVAISTAYRPYWARSSSSTFRTFGSTIGSDVGTNLLHEFGPGIRQMMKGHTPKFVFNFGEGATQREGTTSVVP
jgi:hypothetical protein